MFVCLFVCLLCVCLLFVCFVYPARFCLLFSFWVGDDFAPFWGVGGKGFPIQNQRFGGRGLGKNAPKKPWNPTPNNTPPSPVSKSLKFSYNFFIICACWPFFVENFSDFLYLNIHRNSSDVHCYVTIIQQDQRWRSVKLWKNWFDTFFEEKSDNDGKASTNCIHLRFIHHRTGISHISHTKRTPIDSITWDIHICEKNFSE